MAVRALQDGHSVRAQTPSLTGAPGAPQPLPSRGAERRDALLESTTNTSIALLRSLYLTCIYRQHPRTAGIPPRDGPDDRRRASPRAASRLARDARGPARLGHLS